MGALGGIIFSSIETILRISLTKYATESEASAVQDHLLLMVVGLEGQMKNIYMQMRRFWMTNLLLGFLEYSLGGRSRPSLGSGRRSSTHSASRWS